MTAFHRNARRPLADPGCWRCPPATCWSWCRCWCSRRPATSPGCRTSPACSASWSLSPAWPTRPGPGLPGSAGSGAWSLTLALLAADAGAYRIFSIADYPQDPHLIAVSLAELVILVAAVALVVPDAVRAQAGAPARCRGRLRSRDEEHDGLPGGGQCRSSPRHADWLALASVPAVEPDAGHRQAAATWPRSGPTTARGRHSASGCHASVSHSFVGHRSSCRSCAASRLRQQAGARPAGSRSPWQAAPERATASWARR